MSNADLIKIYPRMFEGHSHRHLGDMAPGSLYMSSHQQPQQLWAEVTASIPCGLACLPTFVFFSFFWANRAQLRFFFQPFPSPTGSLCLLFFVHYLHLITAFTTHPHCILFISSKNNNRNPTTFHTLASSLHPAYFFIFYFFLHNTYQHISHPICRTTQWPRSRTKARAQTDTGYFICPAPPAAHRYTTKD
jgi:hypothetical protein